jgi:GxxExxY protein
MSMDQLTHKVIGMAMEVHRELGPGYNESVYHRCMELELAASGLPFESEMPIEVFYKGRIVGKFEADLVILVDQHLLLELKAVEALTKAHEVQTVNYLTATRIEHGLLFNFGTPSLQFKHKYRHYQKPNPPQS